jgi:Fur family ferric uptake transcriptional regulator
MATARQDVVRLLRGAGLRVTAPRLAVLLAIEDCPSHADAETIAAAVRDRIGDISAQTVYNVLRTFVAAGLIRRIEPAGRPGLYELRAGDNHHHVVCRRCGATADIDCAVGSAPCLEPSQTHDFLIDEAEITFWGLCPACVAAAPVSSGEVTRTRIMQH